MSSSEAETEDNGMTKTRVSRSAQKRAGVGPEEEDVNVMILRRTKKTSIYLPSVPSKDSARLRMVLITEKEMRRLFEEVKGGRKDIPARPEFEVQLVGMNEAIPINLISESKARTANRVEGSTGQGIEVLYDSVKTLYILSEQKLDALIILLRKRREDVLKVNRAFFMVGSEEFSVLEPARQRIWLRFVKLYMDKYATDEEFLLGIDDRRELYLKTLEEERLFEENQVVLSAEEVDNPPTDSDESFNDGNCEPKPIVVRKKTAINSGGRRTVVSPNGNRRTIASPNPNSAGTSRRLTGVDGQKKK